MGVQCRCGRFLAKPRAIANNESLVDVRGDCSRCGPDVQAANEGPWWNWDNWKWPSDA